MLQRSWIPAAFLACCLPACGLVNDSEDHGIQQGWTEGAEGRLQFAFDVEPGANALAPGAAVDVFVSGPGADGTIDVESTNVTVATFGVEHFCSCGAEVEGRFVIRSVSASASCEAGEVKRCENVISAHAHSVGRTELVVFDADGAMLDRAPVSVRSAG